MCYITVVLDFNGVKQDHFKIINTLDERMLSSGDTGVYQSYSCGDNLRLCVELRRNSAFWDQVNSATQITTSVNDELFIVNYYMAREAPEFMQQN
jgi:hypothetical protein